MPVRDYEWLRLNQPNNFIVPLIGRPGAVGFMLAGKCANTSIKKAILDGMGKTLNPGESVHDHPCFDIMSIHKSTMVAFGNQHDGEYNYNQIVAVVRHPWMRVASFWTHKVQDKKNAGNLFRHLGVYDGMTFMETLTAIHNTCAYDMHVTLLTDLYGDNDPTHILRFEYLIYQWARLVKQPNFNWLPAVLPHFNKCEKEYPEPTYENLNMVYKIYRSDFRAYGYREDEFAIGGVWASTLI